MKFAIAQAAPDPALPPHLPVALRDTARTVIALGSGNAPSLEALRKDADAQITGLREELQRRGHPRDVIDDAL